MTLVASGTNGGHIEDHIVGRHVSLDEADELEIGAPLGGTERRLVRRRNGPAIFLSAQCNTVAILNTEFKTV